MTDHIHGCLNCRPDMVPDFSRDDPRYHDGQNCRDEEHGFSAYAFVDGVDAHYFTSAFEGTEGWVLHAGYREQTGQIHGCPCDGGVCVEPRFGRVEVRHVEKGHVWS